MNQLNFATASRGDPFRPAARFTAVSKGDTLLLVEESAVHAFEGAIYSKLGTLIARGQTLREFEAALADEYSPGEISAALEELMRVGFLRFAQEDIPRPQAAFWESVGSAIPGSIELLSLCASGRAMLVQALDSSGLKIGEDMRALVVTVDDYLDSRLAEISRTRKQPWLLAKPVGHTIWIGPLIIPGETACWHCLAAAIKTNRWHQAALYGWGDGVLPPQPSIAALPATLALAAGMIATTAAVWSATGEYRHLEDCILTFDTRTLEQARSHVRRRPQCANCGPSHIVLDAPQRLYSFVSPITGLVSQVQTTSDRSGGLFHARAKFVNPLPVAERRYLLQPLDAFGKGMTPENAERNSIAEALERHSCTHHGDECYIQARVGEIAALPVQELLQFSESQYRARDIWNAAHTEMHWIPERFDPDAPIAWTEVRSLRTGCTSFVPSAFVYLFFNFSVGQPEYYNPDSIGCASGPTLDEAILHALLELIERDALAIWWYNREKRPRTSLSAFHDPAMLQIEEAFRTFGRRAWVLDITTDIRLPVYVAVSVNQLGKEPMFAAAAHISPRVAALKALSELSQIWYWSSSVGPQKEFVAWWRTASLEADSYLEPQGEALPLVEPSLDIAEALQHCDERLAMVGLEPFYIDLTRPDIGMPTARAFVPGLCHCWTRLAPKRLYDVPVKMGWRRIPVAEQDVNPVPCML